MQAQAEERSNLPDDIARVVAATFGGEFVASAELLTGGRSGAATYAVDVGGARYVVRRGVPGDATQVVCLKAASSLGIAPRLRHADIASGITVMDHIEGAPVRLNAAHPDNIVRVARTLRRLHDGPHFPRAVNFAEVIGNMDAAVRSSVSAAPARASHNGSRVSSNGDVAARPVRPVPAGLPSELIEAITETTKAVEGVAVSAPCHNDLNPGNILEANGVVYFVDWDTAANNDPYFDIGEIGVFGCPSPTDRAELLREYLRRTPTELESAHALVTRVTALAFYAAAFFMVSTMGGTFDPSVDPLPMSELLTTFGRRSAVPSTVAVSLLAETKREMNEDAYRAAKRRLG